MSAIVIAHLKRIYDPAENMYPLIFAGTLRKYIDFIDAHWADGPALPTKQQSREQMLQELSANF